MGKSGFYNNKLADIIYDIELDIYHILKTNKDDEVKVGKDDNGVNCILYNDKPLREYPIEKVIDLLENLEIKFHLA